MKQIHIWFLCVFFIFFCISCSKLHRSLGDKELHNYLERSYTKTELDDILKVGMSVSEVKALFGNPFASFNKRNGAYLIFCIDDKKAIKDKDGFFISGFDVNFENGRAVSWDITEELKH